MKEQISTLMDGEFESEAAERILKSLQADETLRESWGMYHLIGDSLRGSPEFSLDFERRLMQRLEAEPTVLAPHHKFKPKPSFIWSAAASVAAVMFVGWVALQQMQAPQDGIAAPAIAENNVSPESVNSYLLAHHELSPDSGMQTAYYVRPVAFAGNGN